MERRSPRNPWLSSRYELNRSDGANTCAPSRGLTFSRSVTPDCASTAVAVCAPSGAVDLQP